MPTYSKVCLVQNLTNLFHHDTSKIRNQGTKNYNIFWNSLQITICKMPKEPPHPRRPLTYHKNPTPPVLKLMIVSDVDLHKSCFYDNCYDMKKMGKVKDIYFNCSYIRVSFEKKMNSF